MSRGSRDDARVEPGRPEAERERGSARAVGAAFRPGGDLALPRTDAREPVHHGGQTYHLRGSESAALATIGAFRVVPAADLDTVPAGRDVWHGDVRSLSDQGLVDRARVAINGEPTHVLTLTRAGKALLDDRRENRDGDRSQQYHAGFVKPRELAHDAQLYRLYQAEAGRIQGEGGRIVRVVLDYELKHDYQTFLNRPGRAHDADASDEVETFAAMARLPVVNGHLELPDLRIEYETPDGRLEYRDVELVTEHYSRSQIAGKAQAGFAMYRAAGRGHSAGGASRTGGTPHDPRHLERWK